jgi:ABC-type branched-subunit amino acid transport system substrate-binding protein
MSLALTSCIQGEAIDTISQNNPIVIGVITPTTGDPAFLGENIVRSVKLATKDLNTPYKIVYEDAGNPGDSKDAITAYNKLVHIDGAQIIIDGMASDGTMAVAPLLESDQVVMITPLTGGENIDTASPYLFRNGPSDILAGIQPAMDLNEEGYASVALFTDNAEYTADISKHFRNTFEGNINEQIVLPGAIDFKTEISKIQNADVIVINTASGQSAAYLIKQLFETRNTLPIYTNFLAYNANMIEIAGVALEGVYVYDPEFADTIETQNFFAQYEQKYGFAPTIPFHTTGVYDAMNMIDEAISEVGNDGPAIRTYLLENIQDWQGMNGVVSFDSNGNTNTGFIQKIVVNGTLE